MTEETLKNDIKIEKSMIEEAPRRTLREMILDYLILIAIAGTIVILDQITKNAVRQSLNFGESWMPLEWLAPYARVLHIQNTGAAFGMFKEGSLIFTGLAVLVTIFILYYFPQVPKEEWPLRLAMGMQMGGAVGNLIDRLIFGHVTDFISVGNFPIFNIADSSISVGAAVLILGIWISERKEKKEKREELLSD